MKLRVLLVDVHLLFTEGLQYLLETYGVDVVGKARNGREAFIIAQKLRPDIILMDIRMPECDGLEGLKLIKSVLPRTKVIMLTTSEDEEDLYLAIKYGASGYLFKDTQAEELIRTLTDVKNGEIILTAEIADKMLKELKANRYKTKNHITDGSKVEPSLTDRQLNILEMVASGKTYKEVGSAIGLTERTVKYHMERITNILQVENKAQVIAYAAKEGLLEYLDNKS